jgi:hypothetical protein
LFVNSNIAANEAVKPVRINRLVSVILNGVVLNKLASENSHDVNAMASYLMNNLSGPVQRNIGTHEMVHVDNNLRKEIGRRINA